MGNRTVRRIEKLDLLSVCYVITIHLGLTVRCDRSAPFCDHVIRQFEV